MTQAYYRKFRPQVWDQVIGQDHVIRTLRNALEQGRIVHAYLFSGPRGTGKTTTARIIAKAVNCLDDDQTKRPCNQCEHCQEIDRGSFLDLIEIDAASNTSVEDVRDLREKINFLPSRGRYKVYIIDEVHMLSNAAFNALLKTLEEPPSHAIFVLATTEVHKIPATVISRCQRHEFRRIPLNFIQALLKEIAENEGIQVEPGAITAIARQATGSMRDAVSLLDQLASTGSTITLELTQNVLGTSKGQQIQELVRAIIERDLGKGIKLVNLALDSGSDPRQFGRQLVDVLRAILMIKIGNMDQVEINQDESELFKVFADQFELPNLLNTISQFDRVAQNSSIGWQPGLQLELALTRSLSMSLPENKQEVDNRNISTKRTDSAAALSAKKTIEKRENDRALKNKKSPHNEIIERQYSKPPFNGEIQETNISETDPVGDDVHGGYEKIHSHWDEVRSEAKKLSPETAALLNSTRSMEVKDDKLVISFSSPLLCSKMENGKNIENAQKAIAIITGMNVPIVCRVAGKNESAVPEGLDIQRDGMVGTALSLGGKITKKNPD